MWDIKPFFLDELGPMRIDFHLNHVGYKVKDVIGVWKGNNAFHLNHVGYKG